MGRGRPSLNSSSARDLNAQGDLPIPPDRLAEALQILRALPTIAGDSANIEAIDHVINVCLPLACPPSPQAAEPSASGDGGGGSLRMLPPPPRVSTPSNKRGSFSLPPPTPRSASRLKPAPLLLVLHDGAWTLVLDYLDIHDALRITMVSKDVRERACETMAVMSLNTLKGDWVSPAALASLCKFRRVKALHWCVGMDEEEEEGSEGHERTRPEEWLGRPLMVWTYLLARLPLTDVTITEGPATNEQALEELWERVLPLCAPTLRRLALSFEGYAAREMEGEQDVDHPPVNVKHLAVVLARDRPFPHLRELHLELNSMSITEQRSLVRGLGQGGVLQRLESLTIGGGTSAYARPAKGPGKDLAAAITKHGAPNLSLLWLQRLDIWDDFEGVFRALGDPTLCPSLRQLYLDLTLDIEDSKALAAALHLCPPSLKTLGMMVMGITARDDQGNFKRCSPEAGVEVIAKAMLAHPRDDLECVDLCLHYEDAPDDNEEPEPIDPAHPPPPPGLSQRRDAVPLLEALRGGAAPRLLHLQLPNCRLTGKAFSEVLSTAAALPRLQTLDISGNEMSEALVEELVAALTTSVPHVYEIMAEECVKTDEEANTLAALCRARAPRVKFSWKSRDAAEREGTLEVDVGDEGGDGGGGGGGGHGHHHHHHHHHHHMQHEDVEVLELDEEDGEGGGEENEGGEEGEEMEMEEDGGGGGGGDFDWDVDSNGDAIESDGEIPEELASDDEM